MYGLHAVVSAQQPRTPEEEEEEGPSPQEARPPPQRQELEVEGAVPSYWSPGHWAPGADLSHCREGGALAAVHPVREMGGAAELGERPL